MSRRRSGLSEHLLLLQPLLDRIYVLLHCHVDELVLRLSLDHAGPLLPDHLDGLWDVDVTVQPWTRNTHMNLIQEESPDSSDPFPPWRLMMSMRTSMTMMVPVLPMPALQRQTKCLKLIVKYNSSSNSGSSIEIYSSTLFSHKYA